ncbi:MAG: hypothetical protein WD688_01690 [Candidatus Binatia bacterium]
MAKLQSDRYSKNEAAERMERALRKLLSTPPKPRGKNLGKVAKRSKAKTKPG